MKKKHKLNKRVKYTTLVKFKKQSCQQVVNKDLLRLCEASQDGTLLNRIGSLASDYLDVELNDHQQREGFK